MGRRERDRERRATEAEESWTRGCQLSERKFKNLRLALRGGKMRMEGRMDSTFQAGTQL